MNVCLEDAPGCCDDELVNISITRGETVAMQMAVATDDGPIDLSGYEIRLTIRFPTPLEFSTNDGSIVILDAAAGTFQLNISSTVSVTFIAGAYPFDAWYASAGGVQTPFLKGTFAIAQNISPVP